MFFTYKANSLGPWWEVCMHTKAGQNKQTQATTSTSMETNMVSFSTEGLMNDLNEFAKRNLPLIVEILMRYIFFQLTIQVF